MPRRGRLRLHRDARARPGQRAPERAGPAPAAGPHRAAGAEVAASATSSRGRLRRRLRQGRRRARRDRLPGDARRARCPAAAARRRVSASPARRRARTRASGPRARWRTTARRRTAPIAEPSSAGRAVDVGHGDVLIAAITSCTNTSNPSVMLAAGLLAKKAVERGLTVSPRVKTSLAPGSRVVTEYLQPDRPAAVPRPARLQPRRLRLHDLHRQLGPARRRASRRPSRKNDLVDAAVLSGQPQLRGAHPPEHQGELPDEPAARRRLRARRPRRHRPDAASRSGTGTRRQPGLPARHLADAGGGRSRRCSRRVDAATYRRLYADLAAANPALDGDSRRRPATVYEWDPASTYIQEPPFFEGFGLPLAARDRHRGARARSAIFGDSVTTDHISPAGAIKATSPAGLYLQAHGVEPEDFNSYGSRRGNDRVMTRGTFANVRIKNLMVPGVEGGVTRAPAGRRDAADLRRRDAVPERGRPAGHLRRPGVRHRQLARLGRQGHAPARRARRRRAELRAHPPRRTSSAWAFSRSSSRRASASRALGLDGTETFDLAGPREGPLARARRSPLSIHRADGSVTRTCRCASASTRRSRSSTTATAASFPYVLRQLLG